MYHILELSCNKQVEVFFTSTWTMNSRRSDCYFLYFIFLSFSLERIAASTCRACNVMRWNYYPTLPTMASLQSVSVAESGSMPGRCLVFASLNAAPVFSLKIFFKMVKLGCPITCHLHIPGYGFQMGYRDEVRTEARKWDATSAAKMIICLGH